MTDRQHTTFHREQTSQDREDAVWLRVTVREDDQGRRRFHVSASSSSREEIGYIATAHADVAEATGRMMMRRVIELADRLSRKGDK